MRNRFVVLTVGFVLITCLPAARADEVYTFIVKKQEEKVKRRWSLSDWLETRDKMRLMDLWLAIHSPSPYEFFIGGNYQRGDFSSDQRYSGWSFSAAGYASIFGLEIQREATMGNRWIGMINLRVFGFHVQGTNITVQAGLKNENTGSTSYRNPLLGVSTTLYVTKYVGIAGLYRHSFTSSPNATGFTFSSNRFEAGAFIDFRFLRLYGDYYWQPETLDSPAGKISLGHSGFQVGSKFFF